MNYSCEQVKLARDTLNGLQSDNGHFQKMAWEADEKTVMETFHNLLVCCNGFLDPVPLVDRIIMC